MGSEDCLPQLLDVSLQVVQLGDLRVLLQPQRVCLTFRSRECSHNDVVDRVDQLKRRNFGAGCGIRPLLLAHLMVVHFGLDFAAV